MERKFRGVVEGLRVHAQMTVDFADDAGMSIRQQKGAETRFGKVRIACKRVAQPQFLHHDKAPQSSVPKKLHRFRSYGEF